MTMIRVALIFLLTSTCAQSWKNWALTTRCSDVHFTFTTAAANRVANNPPKDLFSDPGAIHAFLRQPVAYHTVTGTFAIYGQLCHPVHRPQTPKLQLLVHGPTHNHTDWTLAIDRLGQGLSSRPDPVIMVQDPLQTQLLHLMAREIRDHGLLRIRSGCAEGVDGLKLIYVGHSFGSGLGVHLAAAHPDDFDALVLTGIATGRGNPQPGSLLARWGPASQTGFPPDTPAGYLVSANKTGREALYWSARTDFDADMFERDWAGQGTITQELPLSMKRQRSPI
ncbi:hypothetical protein F4803DRAFT_516678 [Xylaria telfairii]|nr:hypothetical protein F4803DRAFT_516678 [Xylaria telfairii]